MVAEFGLLGPVELRIGGQLVPVPGPRQQGILAVLLTEANRPVSVAALLARGWGVHRRPARPANAVQTHITLLRRVLAPATDVQITWQSAGYRLAVDEKAVDVHRFRRLLRAARAAEDERSVALFTEALGLWRGEPFAELDLPWLTTIREALIRERRAARLDLTDIQLRRGQHAVLVSGLLDQAAEHPLDERLAAQVLLALYRSGRASDALAHYQRMRHRLAEELGIDPSPPLRERYQQILAADPSLAGRTPVVTEHRAKPPGQLPSAPRAFTGRETELAALSNAVDAAAQPGATVVIAGTGGVGKTWLALQWAHQHLDQFPDGQLFVDLRGFSPDEHPMPTETALRGFLHAFGVSAARLPTDQHAQAALWRGLLTGKRLLIVLDNAADAAQVTPLLPGSSAATVLITSRDHLPSLITGHGARHLSVDVLADVESRALLAARLGAGRLAAEPAATAELLACCGGFSLALSIVAGRAAPRPQLPLATLAAELREARLAALDEDDPSVSVPSVLSWSYAALTEEQARVFGLLGLAPGPDLSLPAAASLAGRPTAETRVVLRGLERASLVQRDSGDRWRMHDLIRDYASDRANSETPQAERDRALRRVLEFYLHTGHAGNELLSQARPRIDIDPPVPGCQPRPPADRAEALAWFEAEHRCILAAQQLAAAHGWHRLVWQLAWTLSTFQHRRGYLPENLAAWQAARAAAQHLSEPTALVWAYQDLGHAHAVAGRHEQALTHLHRAIALADDCGDQRVQAYNQRTLAMALGRIGDCRQATAQATEALRLFRSVGDPVWEADLLNVVGWYQAQLGDYDRARVSCESALVLCRRQHSPMAEANTLDSLAHIAHHTGAHQQAVDYYRQARVLLADLGNLPQEAVLLERLGHVHQALGQDEQARAVWREALALYQTLHRVEQAEQVRRQLAE